MSWWKPKPRADLPATRKEAVQRLAKEGATEVLAQVALNDSDLGVRRDAIFALAYLKDGRAITPLWEMVYDAEPSVRDRAAQSLVRIPGINAKQLLAILLVYRHQDSTRTDALSQFNSLGSSAAQALGDALTHAERTELVKLLDLIVEVNLEDKSFADHVIPYLQYSSGDFFGFDQIVQNAAVCALASLGDARVADNLVKMLCRDLKKWQSESVAAVSKRIGAPVIKPLLKHLRNEKGFERQQNSRSLFLITLIQEILEQSASEVDASDLRAIVELAAIKQIYHSGDPRSEEFKSWEAELDCSALKALAQKELNRRTT